MGTVEILDARGKPATGFALATRIHKVTKSEWQGIGTLPALSDIVTRR